MKRFDEIIAELVGHPDCHFKPARDRPVLPEDLRLPADHAAFYERFSEARLFGEYSDPRCHILPAKEFVQVGEAIMGEPTIEGLERTWYALAHVHDGNYIGIDLLPERMGWCYDCFHETYGAPGHCTVIAHSFTELLNLLAEHGDSAFWLNEDFEDYGDAYDLDS